MNIGLDVGSTTIKCVVLSENGNVLYKSYERHFSQIREKAKELLHTINLEFPLEQSFNVSITGSAGMGLAESLNIPFVQEVYAARTAVKHRLPKTDVVIELGGEDAKILFLTDGLEVRMNGSCAGGTGAFIDQMATLINKTPTEMNELAKSYDKIYTIASRCGVFAKTDIQPLLNQGAAKNNVCASIFYAVVNQTVSGLAQGREIKGNIVYLGGPLSFLSELRRSFDKTLNTEGVCPDDAIYYVALGAALSQQGGERTINELLEKLDGLHTQGSYEKGNPLFRTQAEYDEFALRHKKASVRLENMESFSGNAYVGIDAGSTTAKLVLADEDGNIIFYKYMQNNGNPIPLLKESLEEIYRRYPKINIVSSASTGYGEELIKSAFNLDYGLVETVAHYTAAKAFLPEVDFIIDIGGQDIKCFKIKNGAIDNIFLNEACSSGCGSFLQTFAAALGVDIESFSKLGLFAEAPVDLGSRCTVFMNSSVKQSQKDGATLESISAGLSISVVKNALYKVIRAATADDLGEHIVVQGGTFLNDAVLRAFELEIKRDVYRPNIAGLMGAYGASLYAKEKAKKESKTKSSIVSKQQLDEFEHTVNAVTCKLCGNSCRLTVNSFNGGRKFIGGNRCEKPVKGKGIGEGLNIYDYKRELLKSYKPISGKRGKIGLPLALNMYELLPFWHTFFTSLGFSVVTSSFSSRKLYLMGQHTIPSDTVCFPAKLVHGHIEQLLREEVSCIFYPCMSYNLDEGISDNHYNCPVVAYYPEVITANVPQIKQVKFIYDYIGIHREKDFVKKIHAILNREFSDIGGIGIKEIKTAVDNAFSEHHNYIGKIRKYSEQIINRAREMNIPIIVLAGRPYHVDPEISHGIDKLIGESGAAVVSEDALDFSGQKTKRGVLNQWTYHARLYAMAEHVKTQADMNLVQLVSFGCGVDSITTDEVRKILEDNGKIYTQIKIDEITNLGAVKIRLRSLFAATS